MIVRLDNRRNRMLLMVIGLCAVALCLDAWQKAARRAGTASPFENFVCALSAPLQTALLDGVRFTEKEWLAMFRARELAKENARLAAQVADLEDRLSRVGEARGAAAREQALRSAYPAGGRGRLARIIGVGSGGWSDYLILDAGSALGVQARQPVVAREGLVGQVYAVTSQACRAVPLTAPVSSVAVRLERSREAGVLKGLGSWRCEVRYLDPAADLRTGDRVITSGLGGVYPQGLRVGIVTAVRPDEYTPGKVAEVEPAVPLRRTEEVLLLGRQ